jgi:hypothetical protein
MTPIYIVFGVLLLGFIGYVLFVLYSALVRSAYEWSIFRCLNAYGHIAEAEVVNLRSSVSRKTAYYYVDYGFCVGDSTYTRTQQISRNSYNRLINKPTFSVSYMPTKPYISRLAGKDEDHAYRDLTMFLGWAGIVVFPPSVLLWIAVYFITRAVYSRQAEKRKPTYNNLVNE